VPYIRHLEIDRPLGVQDVVEEIAVVVVAGKLCLQGGLELERGGSGGQLRMNVLVAAEGRHVVAAVEAAVVVDLLAEVVGHGLLVGVGLVVRGAAGGLGGLVLGGDSLAQAHGGGSSVRGVGVGVVWSQSSPAFVADVKFGV
jgi:hypothetical protein